MTNRDCTAMAADPENILYPHFITHNALNGIAEDTDDYTATHKPVRLSCDELKSYIKHRLADRKELPVRLHVLFDDLYRLLEQQKEIDAFDLLVELILLADQEPARLLSALFAVLDNEAVCNLEPKTISNTGAFIHGALHRKIVRWDLQHYHEQHQSKTINKSGGPSK